MGAASWTMNSPAASCGVSNTQAEIPFVASHGESDPQRLTIHLRNDKFRVGHNTVRLAVRAEPVETHSPFDVPRANELKRTALGLVK